MSAAELLDAAQVARELAEGGSYDPRLRAALPGLADLLAAFASDWPYLDCGGDDCDYTPCQGIRSAYAVADALLGRKP